jgi:hypothetical protein
VFSRNCSPGNPVDHASRRDIGREEFSAINVAGVTFVGVAAAPFDVCGPLTSLPATLDDGAEDAVIVVSLGADLFIVKIESSALGITQSLIRSA